MLLLNAYCHALSFPTYDWMASQGFNFRAEIFFDFIQQIKQNFLCA
jgi:hypothetical protein